MFLFVIFYSKSFTQHNYIQYPDPKPRCENIKTGTFVSLGTEEEEWKMVVENGVQKEYFDNGKNYIKAVQYFDTENPCIYHLIVIENTNPENGIKKGDKFDNLILETGLNMIKIKSINSDDVGMIFTLEKIKE